MCFSYKNLLNKYTGQAEKKQQMSIIFLAQEDDIYVIVYIDVYFVRPKSVVHKQKAGYIMEDIKVQQIEILETGIEYVKKLVPAVKEILPELRGEEKEDTQEYLNQIIEGINFVIEIVNATMSLINEKEEILNKDGIEEKVQLLNAGLQARDNIKTAMALEEGMLPFLDIFYQVASVIVERENA